jgi:hypothetical protein
MSFQGKLNRYTCRECGGAFVTIDRDDGVTPFMTGCQMRVGCKGPAQSALYRVEQSLRPTHEWYRPTVLEHLRPGERQHVEMGGLLLRRVDQGDIPE